MNAPTFAPGDEGYLPGGIEYRVVQGRKAPGDMRLDIRVKGSAWVPVPMNLGALLADFHFQVEDILYPRGCGLQGGEKYMRFLRTAVNEGHEAASGSLYREKHRPRLEFEEKVRRALAAKAEARTRAA